MINWSLLQPVDIAGSFQQGLERGRGMARQRAVEDALSRYPTVITENPSEKDIQLLAAYAPQQLAAIETIRARRTQAQQEQWANGRKVALGELYASGDRAGAINEAISAGDLELAKQFQGLEPDQKAAVEARVKTAAPHAYAALKMGTDAERVAYFQQPEVRRQLLANGWGEDELNNYQGDPGTLQQVIVGASTLEQMRERDTIKYTPVNEGARLVPFDAFGRPVSNDTGGGPPPAPAAPSAVPATPGGGGALSFNMPQGVTMTSGYRDPAKNAEVGGVANSYHMRRTPDGQPMARDYVPPPGMSMGALADVARQQNPGMDVINEGDHVHLEPRTVRAARRQAGKEAPQKGRVDSASVKAQAQAAIAAGADPVKVRQRAAEMGVSL